MKRVLMIAYHFPPLAGSSGIQRTLRFAKYLPEFGWQPLVLTTTTNAYAQTSDDQLKDVPKNCVIARAPAFDAASSLSIRGRYLAATARPDRWLSWWPGAVLYGMRMILRYRPDVIWSTYPIATAHLIGHTLHRFSGIPWVADFRDPMAQEGDPSDPRLWRSFKRVEEKVFSRAARCTFTTPGAVRFYEQQYPGRGGKMICIENGYDEEMFVALDADRRPLNAGKRTLLHSGIVYPSERDPTHLFQAIARLRDAGEINASGFQVRFRAPVHEQFLRALAEKHQLQALVEILPSLPYQEALTEMLRADALLIMQAANCNNQIPAKLYEYFRCNRPILALTEPEGDTAQTLVKAGIRSIARLDRPSDISDLLGRFARSDIEGMLPAHSAVEASSRRGRTREFAQLLDGI